MIDKKKKTGHSILSRCLVWLPIICLCASCASGSAPEGPEESLSVTETAPVTEEPDTEGPVISGVRTLTTSAGGTLSYRSGVTAVDDRDGPVPLMVDSSKVDLNVPGEYQVIYSAEDSSGNRTEVTATVVVTEPEQDPTPGNSEVIGSDPGTVGQTGNATLENVNALADRILAQIIKDGMSQREKARAIFDYIVSHMQYVGSSDKSSWIVGAYAGLTTGRGDCYNYFACSKALLTRAGIPTVDLQRVNGNSRHYWVLADVGEGYHHFDPCPHPRGYPLTCFLLTEAEVRQYTANVNAHSSYYANYYTYDYSACPVTAAGTPADEPPPSPAQPSEPAPSVSPELPAEPGPEGAPEPAPEQPEEPGPEQPEEPDPGVAPEPSVPPEGQEE